MSERQRLKIYGQILTDLVLSSPERRRVRGILIEKLKIVEGLCGIHFLGPPEIDLEPNAGRNGKKPIKLRSRLVARLHGFSGD